MITHSFEDVMNEIITSIKYAVILAVAFYSFARLTKSKLNAALLLDIFFATGLGIAVVYATYYFKALAPMAMLLAIFVYSLCRHRMSVLTTATLSIISFGISIALYGASYVLTLPIAFILFVALNDGIARNIIMISILSALQLTAVFLIFRIKRLKSGIDTKNHSEYIDILLILSLLAIFVFSLFYTDFLTTTVAPIISITMLVGCILMTVFILKHITQHYRKRIYTRNETLYEQRIDALEAKQAELIKQNEELAAIIHRDNKLIPAIVGSAKRLVADIDGGDEVADMIDKLECISEERARAVRDYQASAEPSAVPKTGDTSVDAVLNYLYGRAARENISIVFRISENSVPLLLEKATDKIDVNTALCDLGENALIAVKNAAAAKVLVAFGVENGAPSVSFYDNGEYFDDRVIAGLGKRRITTHKDDGGNGIGLVTLFKILQKYDASYSLDERLENSDYVKCVKIIFDGKHTTSVFTARRDIKRKTADLIGIPV